MRYTTTVFKALAVKQQSNQSLRNGRRLGDARIATACLLLWQGFWAAAQGRDQESLADAGLRTRSWESGETTVAEVCRAEPGRAETMQSKSRGLQTFLLGDSAEREQHTHEEISWGWGKARGESRHAGPGAMCVPTSQTGKLRPHAVLVESSGRSCLRSGGLLGWGLLQNHLINNKNKTRKHWLSPNNFM